MISKIQNFDQTSSGSEKMAKGSSKSIKSSIKKTTKKTPAKKSGPPSRWPTERQVLFKPDRQKYVRKVDRPQGCVFCSALEQGVSADSLILYAGRHAMVIMNKYPYNSAHLLILPRRHCGDFLELTEDEHLEINRCLRTTVAALKAEYRPDAFNVGMNLGAASGAGIPDHLHYHVIPRWAGDTNFFPLIANSKVVIETLETTFERLLPYFE